VAPLRRSTGESADVQVLTFDFHNTLAHCDPWFELEVRTLPRAVIERLAIPHKLEPDAIDASYRSLRKRVIASGQEIDAYDGVAEVLDCLGLGASRAQIATSVDRLMAEALAAMVPIAGAVDTVRHVHAEGIPLGIISSAVHHDSLEWTLERLGLASCFRAVVTSARSGYYKSTPAIYDYALAQLGGIAGESVHVGDSLRWDVAMAQQAGMRAVWLQSPRKEVFSTGPVDATPELSLASLYGAGPILGDLLASLRVGASA
jgi:HAD superfamily hydrolase (TIGR01509 family)